MMRKTFMILIVILLAIGLVVVTASIALASPGMDGFSATPPPNTGTPIAPIGIVAVGMIIAGIEYARRKLFCGTSNTGLDGMIARGRAGPPDDRDEMSIMNDIDHRPPRQPTIGGVLAAY